ncbi:MAG: alpha/beta fold hydrolase [Paracoccaceae bacterium]|nr:alpha/beta fold hydrolase [Paracoccaceae bacterium]
MAGPNPWTGFADPGLVADLMSRLRHGLAAGGGVEIGATPKDEIWRDGKVSLCRYRREEEANRDEPPLLVVHGLIGRQTISDLEPGRSLVQRLLGFGADIFVLDWGSPGPEDRCKDFTDYAEDHLGDALAEIRKAAGRPKAAILGICQGGVFALCHAARHPGRVAGVIAAITPVDFHADKDLPPPENGLLNHWIRNLPETLLTDLIDDRGMLAGQLTGALFQQLKPARTLAKYTYGLASMAADKAAMETFLRMETWLADRPDMPGAAAKEWLIALYQQNRLVEGKFKIAGRPVDLGAIACPVLNIFGSHDHIVPPACSRALGRYLAPSLYTELEVPTGHVGVFVSRQSQQIVAPAIADWLGAITP